MSHETSELTETRPCDVGQSWCQSGDGFTLDKTSETVANCVSYLPVQSCSPE